MVGPGEYESSINPTKRKSPIISFKNNSPLRNIEDVSKERMQSKIMKELEGQGSSIRNQTPTKNQITSEESKQLPDMTLKRNIIAKSAFASESNRFI